MSPSAHEMLQETMQGLSDGLHVMASSQKEISCSLNKPADWILALVEVPPTEGFSEAVVVGEERAAYGPSPACVERYVRHPFLREPDIGATSVSCDWSDLWERGIATSDG